MNRHITPHTGVVALVLVLSLMTGAQAADGHKSGEWMTDHGAAKQRAAAERKPMLMLFTGSDWCGFCIKLQKEVFSTNEFRAYAAKNLVLLELDFPRRKRLPSNLVRQNERLMKEYEVEGFPTVAVFNRAGKLVGGLGYEDGGARNWIAKLEKLVGKS